MKCVKKNVFSSGHPGLKRWKFWLFVSVWESISVWFVIAYVVFAGALQIENSEESDQGKYECVAVNSAGTRYSAPANLYVRGKIFNQTQNPVPFHLDLLSIQALPRPEQDLLLKNSHFSLITHLS